MGWIDEFWKLYNESEQAKSNGNAGGGVASSNQNKVNNREYIPTRLTERTTARYPTYSEHNALVSNISSRMTVKSKKDEEEEKKKKQFGSSYLTGIAPTVSSPYAAALQSKDVAKAILGVKREEKDTSSWGKVTGGTTDDPFDIATFTNNAGRTYADSIPGVTLEEAKAKMESAEDMEEQKKWTEVYNQKTFIENAKLFSETKMDGTNHSVLEEMNIISEMDKGEEKNKRKEAVLKKMEELGVDTDNYAIYSGDDNFTWGNFGKWLQNAGLSGLNAFNKGVATTLDVAVGNILQGVGWEDNPISSMREFYDQSYEGYKYNTDLYAQKLGGKFGEASEWIESAAATIPTALLALVTAGASTGATTASLTTNALQSTGNVLTRAGLTVESMMRNPQYWLSFAQTYGTDYETAKDMGVDDNVAALGATLTSLMNAGVEIGADGTSGIQGLPSDIAEGGIKKITNWIKDTMHSEGKEEVVQDLISNAVAKAMYDNEVKIFDPKQMGKNYFMGATIGGALGGGQVAVQGATNVAVNAVNDYQASKLTDIEQKVVDKVYNDLLEKMDGEVSNKDKKQLLAQVRSELEKGGISTDIIEEVLGGESYSAYKALKQESDEFSTLYKTESGKLSEEQRDRLAELKEKNKANSYENALLEAKDKVTQSVYEQVKGSRLVESYYERGKRGQAFEADLTKYDDGQKAVIQKAVDSGILNNTRRTHEFVDMIARISADKGVLFDFTNNERLKSSGFALDGKTVNGYVSGNNITLNIQSAKALNSVVGHEISHVLEGTELYDALRETVYNYAISKEGLDSFNARLKATEELYKGMDADPDAELTADLIGDYLFTDTDFINRLSTENRNIFQKMYDEIKYLSRVATAGSKEARELEKVKKTFEQVWREKATEKDGVETRYSLEKNGKSKYNKRSRYSETETLFMSWENGSAPVGDVKKFKRFGKIRYYEKTENGCVELSRSQYNERNGRNAEETYGRIQRQVNGIADPNGTSERNLSGSMDGDRYAGRTSSVSGQTFGEKLRNDIAGSSASIDGHDRGNGLTQTEYNDEASDESGASFVTFSNDYATIRNFMKDGDTGAAYSLSEDVQSGNDIYSRRFDIQQQIGELNRSIREFEDGSAFKDAHARLSEAIRNDKILEGIKEYQQWCETSGYDALKEKRDALQADFEKLSKEADEQFAKESVDKEKSLIEKSGLSEADYFRKQAVKNFGYTPYFYDAGYLTPNGKMLNFSGEKGRHFGSRGQDHRGIGIIYENTQGSDAMIRFMNDGNIRIMGETPGLDISSTVEPTKEQYATIKKFARESASNGYFAVDISDENGRNIGNYEYNGRVNADRVVNDIKYFFQTGKVREASRIADFLSLSEEGKQHPVYGNNNVYGSDIAYEGEPIQRTTEESSDVAPVVKETMTADVAPVVTSKMETTTPTVSKKETVEDIAPIYQSNDKSAPEGQTTMFEPVQEETTKKQTRKEYHQSIINNIKSIFKTEGFDFDKVLKDARNLSTWSTVDNTPQRVMEKSLGYKEGGILADITVNKVAQNETEGIKWLNAYVDQLKQISKQYHIKPGSKESAAAQMYAEGFYVNENNEIVRYGDPELIQDFKNPKVRERIKGLARDPRIRQVYDETLDRINESRVRNGYPEIPRLDNYFLHFRAMEDTFSRLGLPFNPNDIRAKDLPTDLNGVTADLKPGQPFFASAMHRTGKRTSFDLLGGMERYLSSAKNQIYHIDDIQTLRALRNYIADTYGQANGLEGLDALSDVEAEERIKEVYNSHLSTFAKFLNEEANVLAGKTALIDRGLEGIIGRRGITFLNTLNRQVGSNMVGFNVSSSLTNFLPVAQTFAKTNKFDFTKAFAQTVANKISGGRLDSFAEDSPVVIRRKGEERFYRTPWQKIADPGYALMGAVDSISTELIARTKYNELTRKGMDSQKAHFETDKWVSKLMGDRSLGQQPQLYNSKMLGLVTKFQLEVRNQLDSQFYDTIQETKVSNEHIQNGLLRNAKTAAKITTTFVELAVVQHLFGKAFESMAGYNPAFDIIEVLMIAFGFDDDEESEDTALDNIEQGFMALMEDMPYASTFLEGGRIPISAALPIKEFVKGEDKYGNEKSRWEIAGEVAPYYLMPGGFGQLKKTVQGLSMFSDEHPIAGSYTAAGNLRFPVEDTLGNRVKAGVFGQYASENARKYFDEERKTLKPEEAEILAGLNVPVEEYWEYRDKYNEYQSFRNQLWDAAKEDDATVEDIVKSRYISSINSELNDLYEQQKELASGNDELKQFKMRDIQRKMEKLISESKGVDNTFVSGIYAEVGDRRYDYNADKDTWYEITPKNSNGEDNWFYQMEQKVTEAFGISYSEYWNNREEYNFAYEKPEKYAVAQAVGGYNSYKYYTDVLDNQYSDSYIRADKDSKGNSIKNSRKKKIIAWINELDADYGMKMILFKREYPSEDSYNDDIVDYLNSRDDISAQEMKNILEELGATVDSKGYIKW